MIKFALTKTLELAWQEGIVTWITNDHIKFCKERAWHQVLLQITNVRGNGWGIPSPWE